MAEYGLSATVDTEKGVADAKQNKQHADKMLQDAEKRNQNAKNQQAQKQREQAKTIEDAKKAQQPTGAIPATAPSTPQPPAAPADDGADIKNIVEELLEIATELLESDEQDNKDGKAKDKKSLKEQFKKGLGKAWATISDMFGGDKSHEDTVAENVVAGVRGSRQISMRVEAKRDKLPKDRLPSREADNVSESKLNKKQLDMGQEVEMEHTDDPKLAREIARDHLAEELKNGKEKSDQEYYTQLKKVHEDKCSDSVPAFWRRNLDYGSR